jgi:exosome complex component RRP42
MLQISPSEISFLRQGVEQDVRADGRSRLDYRPITMESGVLPQSNGSARISLGNGETDLLASVKAEVGEPSTGAPNSGRIEISVECLASVSNPMCSISSDCYGLRYHRPLEEMWQII